MNGLAVHYIHAGHFSAHGAFAYGNYHPYNVRILHSQWNSGQCNVGLYPQYGHALLNDDLD